MIDPPQEVALIVNLRARLGLGASEVAARELRANGIDVRQQSTVTTGPELISAVRRAIGSGIKTLVVGGGDGTISTVADLLVNRPDLMLGLLPVGTGNEVARVLGLPLDIAGACRVIAEGNVGLVDLAEANGDFFVHTAMVGYPAHVNHSVPVAQKQRLGKLAYVRCLLASLARIKPFRAQVISGSKTWEGETILVVVGNGLFHTPGRVLLPPEEAMISGLTVYTPRDCRLPTIFRLAIDMWVTHQRHPELLVSMPADRVTVVATPAQEVDLDGEFGMYSPVDFRVVRDALRLIVPQSFALGTVRE